MLVDLSIWAWRLLIALVFISAAIGKWREGVRYVMPETIYDRIVAFSPARHYAIIGFELLVGAWVASSIRPRWSSVAAGTVFFAFTVILAVEIWRRTPMLCGCGIVQIYPDGDPRIDLGIGIARNLFLILGCAWIYLLSGSEKPQRA